MLHFNTSRVVWHLRKTITLLLTHWLSGFLVDIWVVITYQRSNKKCSTALSIVKCDINFRNSPKCVVLKYKYAVRRVNKFYKVRNVNKFYKARNVLGNNN
jgi:hypothetical protein